jgi:hypothetical protein
MLKIRLLQVISGRYRLEFAPLATRLVSKFDWMQIRMILLLSPNV